MQTWLKKGAAFWMGEVAAIVLVAALSFPVSATAAEQSQVTASNPIAGDAGASTAQVAAASEGEDVNDPLEGLNRLIFGFNEIFQMVILRPATGIYETFIPPPIREVIGHMIDNISTPVILANDILQGEGERAWQTTRRFAINTTVGIGGVMDVATDMGIPSHNEDFGQTLAKWGVGEGFYLVLPLYGPSNPRDAVGKLLVDPYMDPLGMYLSNIHETEAGYARQGVGAVDEYGGVVDELDQIKKTSVDFYAAVRSMYRQKRAAEIGNGSEMDLPPIPDLGTRLEDWREPDGNPAATVPPPPGSGPQDQLSQGPRPIGSALGVQ